MSHQNFFRYHQAMWYDSERPRPKTYTIVIKKLMWLLKFIWSNHDSNEHKFISCRYMREFTVVIVPSVVKAVKKHSDQAMNWHGIGAHTQGPDHTNATIAPWHLRKVQTSDDIYTRVVKWNEEIWSLMCRYEPLNVVFSRSFPSIQDASCKFLNTLYAWIRPA